MTNKHDVIEKITEAFSENEYPGDQFLQGSFEGCEPYEVIEPFKGRTDWKSFDAEMLDQNYTALNFFSEAGLRFFLPAYMIADLNEELFTADPMFVLTNGFSDVEIKHETKSGVFTRKIGKTTLVNPRRYGAITFYDHARYRLSVFTREEARAIVAYLEYKKDSDHYNVQTEQINAALELFWSDRAENAPTAKELKQHMQEEREYLAALAVDHGINTDG